VSQRVFLYGGGALLMLLAVLFWLSRSDAPPPSSSRAVAASGPRHAPAAPSAVAPSEPVAVGDAPAPPRHPPTEQELVSAATVIAIAPTPQPGEPPAPAPLPPAPLPADLEGERQRGIAQWKAQARGLLAECARGDDRREVDLQVMFAPAARAAGQPEQLVVAQWVAAPLESLRALADKHDPIALQSCLQRARRLSFHVALSGDALAHAFPSGIERFKLSL
jgi:hypothetical protein